MDKRVFARHHLEEELHVGIAESEGNEKLARRLGARTKLRLASVSNDELWEFAIFTASPPEWSVKSSCQNIKPTVKNVKTTTNQRLTDPQTGPPQPGEKIPTTILIIEGDSVPSDRLIVPPYEAGFSVIASTFPSNILAKTDEINPCSDRVLVARVNAIFRRYKAFVR